MRAAFLISLFAVLAGCVGKDKKMDFSDTAPTPEFEKGVRALDASNYAAAAAIFDGLLVAKPGSQKDLITVFNSGAAYEGLSNCAKAADRFRQIVRSSAGKFARLEAQAMYRLSLMYECLGQDTKAVTSMLDSMKREADLPNEVVRAELPARLAAAYARMGNRDKALEYFNMASQGLKTLLIVETSAQKQKDLLARTLFFMGRLSPAQRKADVEPMAYLQSLSMQQPYLLQAIEMNQPNWSVQAKEDLALGYDNIVDLKVKDADRRQYWVRSLQVVNELRKIRLPNSGRLLEDAFSHVDKAERRIQNEMVALGESNPLTPEAQQINSLKREGRPVNPNVSIKPPMKKEKRQ